jgi:HEAT repeat protein
MSGSFLRRLTNFLSPAILIDVNSQFVPCVLNHFTNYLDLIRGRLDDSSHTGKMDQRKFEQLLQSVLQRKSNYHEITPPARQSLTSEPTADTERVKAATAILRKDYYPNPQSLAFLLQILASHESPQLRQLAAVEARTLVAKHWTAVPAGSKPEVRMMLLQTTLAEQENLVRHSAARVIAAVASIDLENKEWLDLPTTLQQAASSQDAAQREVGVYILYTLLDTMGDGFVESTGPLFSLFEKTIQDPQSAEVRLNTMLALSRIGMAMDPEEDGDSLAAFRRAVPSMVAVLKEAVDSGDEKRAENAFEVFQILLTCDTSLLASHFQDLVQFMTTLASSKEIPDESRTQALSFLMQCVKHRRMRIQGLKLGEPLTLKAMEIVTELGDLRNDVEEAVPAQTALGLLDALSQSLPPAQVIVPLLKALPHYVDNQNPAYRRAGILSLGFCVEGAPDFIGTQLKDIIPIVLRLLDDPEVKVRQAALNAFARLAEDLAEEMAVEHEKLMAALIKNLDAAGTPDGHKSEDEQRMDIIIGVCSALDSLVDGLDPDDAATYVPELVPRLSRLFTHPEFRVKTVAIAALGSLAGNGKDSFKPYFEELMTGLSPYVTIKDSEDELDLRGAVCDAMGSMATAVGPEAFQKYVQPLMTSSEEALQLGHSNLRESTFILWSTLAKVYKDDFSPFLPGVMKGLFDCLDQDEGQLEMGLGEEAQALLGPEIIVGGKKIKISGDENGLATLHKAGEDETDIIDIDDLDDDDDAWDDFAAGSGVALEKEIALEVIGDVLTHIEDQFLPYLQQTMEKTMELIEHSYEGVRKAAIGTMWRTYATFFQLSEKQGKMAKWQPGIPVKVQPTHDLVQLGDLVMKATLATWSEELDR